MALVERAIRNSSKSHDIVLDPFGGSGTTLIGCEGLDRQARLIELDPRYYDVIVLAGVHREAGGAQGRWPDVRRDRAGADDHVMSEASADRRPAPHRRGHCRLRHPAPRHRDRRGGQRADLAQVLPHRADLWPCRRQHQGGAEPVHIANGKGREAVTAAIFWLKTRAGRPKHVAYKPPGFVPQNLIIAGPSGVGKSWLAYALGQKACRDHRSVLYHRAPRLFPTWPWPAAMAEAISSGGNNGLSSGNTFRKCRKFLHIEIRVKRATILSN